jgi:predicted TIM-barrel fold metal-dependent hydrolase
MIDGHTFVGRSIYLEQSAEELIAEMDRLGVQTSVVVAPPPGPFYDEANALVQKAATRYTERLVPIFKANPHIEAEADKTRMALDNGFRGIQLDPTNDGYGVSGDFLEPFVDLAAEFNVPVYIHSGDSIFCPPEAISELAERFEGVAFVTNTSRRSRRALKNRENLYLTTRPFPTLAFQRGIADSFDLDRIIFASDSPMGSLEVELRAFEIAGIKGKIKEKIMGGNLLRIMRL